MKTEMLKKIIKGIVRNEFEHVADYEQKFISMNKELKELGEINYDIYKKEQQKLFNNYIDNLAREMVIMELLYFKEGLRAGLTNLKFLNEVNGIKALF
ncbi:hypothetical protein [uncultured Clostridium sp.]|uniref:hypothetical protein n=1 Tax=uncultured Clostridium sp. TaxID=59620 RepID=UPI0025E2D140|nr:hypothetical protein [uncultured Clostridium sp.]